MDIPQPPIQIVSYGQFRLTAGERTPTYGSVRRFRVNLSTEPTKKERWLVQLFTKENNQSPTDNRLWLHDVSWRKKMPQGTWTVGQFRPPFSLQRLTTDRELLVPDRATASDLLASSGGLAHSFGRDIGVQWERSGLSVGIFRGQGAIQQVRFGSIGPLLVGRVTHKYAGVQWGGAFMARHADSADLSKVFAGAKSFQGWDTRAELDVSLKRGRWHSSAEWLAGRLEGNVTCRAEGGYADVTYKLEPRAELVAQIQTFAPSIGTNGVTLGVNLIPGDHRNRLQVFYQMQRRNRIEVQYQQFFADTGK